MEDYGEGFYEEEQYLENAVAAIRQQLEAAEEGIKRKRKSLRTLRQDMWDNTDHSPGDFSGVADISLYRSEVHVSTQTYANSLKNIKKYNKMLETPYFGRFDFLEEGYDTKEKIYVGRGTLMDPETCKVLVYDWRAPVSSVYYRYELGPAQYDTPSGMVSGEVLLKRQYQIQDGKLRHFFDCSVVITDEILMDILSRNASLKMKSIVESIQKEQDVIIRDTVNDLVMVQGAAGSGKTSIALHRIAYLLYEGLGGTLTPDNIIIVSPNEVFSQYVSNVLPDLGEQNVEQITVDRIAQDHLADDFLLESRALQMERVMGADERLPFQNIDFKGSNAFKDILDRLMWYYEHEILPFEDVYYNGVVVAARQDLKSRFLNKRNLPMARRGQRIEAEIWEAIHPLRKKRLQTLEGIVQKSQGHDLEIRAFSRLLSIKESKRLKKRLQKFTQIDFREVYKLLFSDRKLFFQLAKGLELPGGIEDIIAFTSKKLEEGKVCYEDAAPLLYLKMKIQGTNAFPWIKQVVIDEGQDYSPMQYEVFKLLFRGAAYTILGDIHQSLERAADVSVYDAIHKILDKKRSVMLSLSKTYRSTWEISAFNNRLLGGQEQPDTFERHGEEPRIIYRKTRQLMNEAVVQELQSFWSQGFTSVAVICKTQREAEKASAELEKRIPLCLIRQDDKKTGKEAVVITSYMAKGLEFDAVLIYGAGKEAYFTELDRRLLYIACTRALHRLVLCYTGEKIPWLP